MHFKIFILKANQVVASGLT